MSENIAQAIMGDSESSAEETPLAVVAETAPAPEPAADKTTPQTNGHAPTPTPELPAVNGAGATAVQPPSSQQQPERWMVPGHELLKEREKRQEYEKRLREYETQQQAHAQIPSIHEDPEGYAAHLERQRQMDLLAIRFDVAQPIVRKAYGNETVDAALAWGMEQAQRSPAFQWEYTHQPNPLEWVVQQKRFHDAYKEIGDDVEGYVKRRAPEFGFVTAPLATGQAQAVQTPTTASPTTPAPMKTVPVSLAAQPNAGGIDAVVPSDDQLMDEALSAARRPRKRGSG